jgi:uncharacterized protein (TIGR02271 family)
MAHELNHLVPKGGSASDASHLGRLNDLDEYKVADGYPDIRGWDVRTNDGRTVGKVGDLIVDTAAMRVRYLDVEVDRSLAQAAKDAATPGNQERHTLLPIGNVQLDERGDHVMVDGYTLEQIGGLPRYNGQTISREYENSLRSQRGVGAATGAAVGAAATGAAAAATNHYDHTDYDDQRLYSTRRQQADNARRLTLAEEQLAVGKREVSAGEVELRKTVDVEHVAQQIGLTRDEVTVERRPVAPGENVQASISEGEIRVPVMEEQLVVEKRLVPREEIIVRKRAVQEQQTVEADVRRERLEVDDASARAAGSLRDGGTGGATGMSGTNR